MAKVKITNTIDPGRARGVETPYGTVFIEPGETVEVELVDGHKLYEGLVAGDAAAKKAAKKDAEDAAAE